MNLYFYPHQLLTLSAMVLPHGMVRVLLAEQFIAPTACCTIIPTIANKFSSPCGCIF